MTKPPMPPIGVPRVYDGDALPVLYPGETASVRVTLDPFAIADALERGETSVQARVTGWLVEPAPGWSARWLRWRYRIFGQLFAGPPKLDVSMQVVERGTSPTAPSPTGGDR